MRCCLRLLACLERLFAFAPATAFTMATAAAAVDSPVRPSVFHEDWSDTRLPPELLEILKSAIGPGYNATTIPGIETMLQMGLVRELDAEGRPVPRTGSPHALSPAPSPKLSGSGKSNVGIRMLDNACGIGAPALLMSLLASMDLHLTGGTAEIIASDTNPDRLATLKDIIKQNNFRNITCEQWPMENLGAPSNYFTHCCVNFSAHWAVDEAAMLKEIFRTLRPGGVVGFATWARSGWRVHSGQDLLKILPSGGWEDPARIKRVLEQRGFVDIESKIQMHTPQIEQGHMQKFVGIHSDSMTENTLSRQCRRSRNSSRTR